MLIYCDLLPNEIVDGSTAGDFTVMTIILGIKC